MLFGPIGEAGQEQLQHKHVLIIGAGALGTQSAESLVRAGVGKLTIVDRDYIEWSNLQRQQLYTENDAIQRTPKAVAAKSRLREINSEVIIDASIMDVTPKEMEQLIQGVDLVLDATDNFDIRMIINDTAIKYHVPWIFGSCVGSYGMSYTIIPGETPCLHCMLGKIPIGSQTCDTAGIIQPAVSQVVVHQTTEALKILTGNQAHLRKKLVSFDLWTNQTVNMKVDRMKKGDCPSCGEHPTYPFLQFDAQTKTAVLCGRDAVQIRPPETRNYDLQQISKKLEKIGGEVQMNPFLLAFTYEKNRMVLFKDGRALIHGTNNTDEAKTLYYKYFG